MRTEWNCLVQLRRNNQDQDGRSIKSNTKPRPSRATPNVPAAAPGDDERDKSSQNSISSNRHTKNSNRNLRRNTSHTPPTVLSSSLQPSRLGRLVPCVAPEPPATTAKTATTSIGTAWRSLPADASRAGRMVLTAPPGPRATSAATATTTIRGGPGRFAARVIKFEGGWRSSSEYDIWVMLLMQWI